MSVLRALGRTTARGCDLENFTGTAGLKSTFSGVEVSLLLKGVKGLASGWVLFLYGNNKQLTQHTHIIKTALSEKYPKIKPDRLEAITHLRFMEHKTLCCLKCGGQGCSKCRFTGRGEYKGAQRERIINASRGTFSRKNEEYGRVLSDIDLIIDTWERQAVRAMKINAEG